MHIYIEREMYVYIYIHICLFTCIVPSQVRERYTPHLPASVTNLRLSDRDFASAILYGFEVDRGCVHISTYIIKTTYNYIFYICTFINMYIYYVYIHAYVYMYM